MRKFKISSEIRVRTIDERTITSRLKKSGDKETLNYIKELKNMSKEWERLFYEVMNKYREASEKLSIIEKKPPDDITGE